MGFFFLCISLLKHKMKVTLFFVLIAAIAVLGQGDFDLVERIVLDDFTNGANTHGISITLSADLGVNDPDRTETEMFGAGSGCTGLLGCERDMSLTIFIGLQGRTFSLIFSQLQQLIILMVNGQFLTQRTLNLNLFFNMMVLIMVLLPVFVFLQLLILILLIISLHTLQMDKVVLQVLMFSLMMLLMLFLDKLLLLVTQIHLILKHQLHLVLDPQHQLLQVLLNVVSSVTVQSSHVTLYMMMMMMKKIFS